MIEEQEQCLRCEKLVVYQTNDDGTFCPECGWSRAAAQRFAKERPFHLRTARASYFVNRLRPVLSIPAAFLGYYIGLFTCIIYSYLRFPYLREEGVDWYREVLLNPGKLGWAHAVTTLCALYLAVFVAPRARRSIILGIGIAVVLIVLPVIGFTFQWAGAAAPLRLFAFAWLWRAFGAGLAWAFAQRLMRTKKDLTNN